jgi:Spy/CpxP family protein refolding chaperone
MQFRFDTSPGRKFRRDGLSPRADEPIRIERAAKPEQRAALKQRFEKGIKAMKKLFATCLLAAAFAVPATFAQTTDAVATATAPAGRHSPAAMIDHRVNTMTTVLTLNSSQQTQVRTILTNQETTESGIRTSMKAAHTNLKTAIQSNDTASIEQISNTIGTLTAQSVAAHAKAQAAIYQLLNPEQQTKAAEVPELLGGPGGPGGFGHGGPR